MRIGSISNSLGRNGIEFRNNAEEVDDLVYEDPAIKRIIQADNTQSFNDAVVDAVQDRNKLGSLKDVWLTYKKIWIEASTLFLVYVGTLICYPGLIIQTRLSFIYSESWYQVTILALFSIADIVGRFIATAKTNDHSYL
jgi:hypothetical protein